MGTESPKRNAFALGFSLPLASFFRDTETKTQFGLRFGPPLATALGSDFVKRSGTPSRLTDSSYVGLTCYTTSIVIFFLLLAFVLVFAIDLTLSILTVS